MPPLNEASNLGSQLIGLVNWGQIMINLRSKLIVL